jgi:7-cyano-7-deazaguanine synthase
MEAIKQHATVLMSGGIDSAACAYLLRERGFAVSGVFIDHGQAAAEPEGRAVTLIAEHLGVQLQTIRLEGSKSFGPGELVGRNGFLIFAALLLLISQEYT